MPNTEDGLKINVIHEQCVKTTKVVHSANKHINLPESASFSPESSKGQNMQKIMNNS